MGRFLMLAILWFLPITLLAQEDENWSDILKRKAGTITYYWYPNNISITDSKDILDGVEHELAESFVAYLKKKYKVDLELRWVETDSFSDVLQTVRSKKGASFGSSSISITPDRAEYLNFTPPYLSDIAVLISNSDIPIAQTEEEFRKLFDNAKAVTIKNTTLLQALEKLKQEQDLHFTYEYVKNTGQIIEKIESTKNGFGYVDLPNFLVALENSPVIRRQFFHPLKLEGIAMIYPKGSDWDGPVNDYFSSDQYETDKERIILKYLGEGATEIIARIATSAEIGPYEEIIISNREKDSQYLDLLEATKREQERTRLTNLLILAIAVIIMVMSVVVIRFRMKAKSNQLLREKNQMIEERNKELKRINEEKNDLINILAHDLRSPLSNILNISLMLKDSPNLSDEDKKMNSYVTTSSEKMATMINKILDVDAIESGNRNLKMEVIDLSKVCNTVLTNYKTKANNKDIAIAASILPDLKIYADKLYTEQVIDNLLSNAIKYSEPGSEVQYCTVVEGDRIKVSIKDQGPGFSEEDQRNLFKKYHRLSAQPTAGENSVGLGLSIVKSYVDMIGAEISYETEVGKGTTFTIYFQLAQ